MKIKVGFGFDVHQLKENHPFVLGGVHLEHHKGAFGHSDADVLVHVICDALLGAAAGALAVDGEAGHDASLPVKRGGREGAALRPQAQRLYSIASSRKRVGDEAHLTVDVLRYQAHGHPHLGAASAFLADLDEGAQVPVYIEPNERFRVPADASRDIIMIGPGTGIAPFRGFVQERAETGAAGRNWLFFGAQHFNTGFLYQVEWQDALQRKELHRLDLAFSRDQAAKVYVQDRLRERGAELYAWLQGGAHLYVCGSIAMGKDVHAALLDVVAAHNGGNAETAAEYLTSLQTQGRYARDVY